MPTKKLNPFPIVLLLVLVLEFIGTASQAVINPLTQNEITPDEVFNMGPMAMPMADAAPATSLDVTNIPVNTQTFFQTVGYYFTTANTNFTWTNCTLEVSIGADYMAGVNWAQYVSLQYDLQAISQSPLLSRLAFEVKMRNAAIAGTIDSVEAGPQLTLINYYSVRLQFGLDAGYDLGRDSAMIEPKFALQDKMTPNTYLGLVLSVPVWFDGKALNKTPDIGIETGFTY